MSEIRYRSKGATRHLTDLIAWQQAFELGRSVFLATKKWPKEGQYALTDQVRRSSRSVGANIAEAWGKRRYEAHFVSKLTDADAGLHETEHWLLCALEHGYIEAGAFKEMKITLDEVGRMLGSIMANPGPFLLSRRANSP